MPEGDTIRRLADKISRRFAGQRCARCVVRDPRLVGVDLAGLDAGRRRRRRQAPPDPLRQRQHRARASLDDGLVDGRADRPRTGVAPADRAVDGDGPADRHRRSGARVAADRRTRVAPSGISAPICADLSHPTSTRWSARLDASARRRARCRAARPAQRRRVRQRLRGRGAVHRRRVPEPAGRHDRRFGASRWRRCGAHPHQRRARPAEHDRPATEHRRSLDLRPTRTAVPAVRDPARRLGGAGEPVGAGVGVVSELPARDSGTSGRRAASHQAAGIAPGSPPAVVPPTIGGCQWFFRSPQSSW